MFRTRIDILFLHFLFLLLLVFSGSFLSALTLRGPDISELTGVVPEEVLMGAIFQTLHDEVPDQEI